MRCTMMGWMMPCTLMDAASSLSGSSLNTFRGWYSFGTILSSSISWMPRAFLSLSSREDRSGMSAPSPLPSACFCMAQHILGQIEIALGALRADIIEQHRLAVARRLAQGHVAVDHGLVDLAAEVFPDLLGHLLGKIVPSVVHGEQDALDLELR